MSLPKLLANLNIHQSKPDKVRGQASATKEYFDKAPNDIKNYINDTLIPEIESLDTANIKKTGDQTIDGVKTFVKSPIVPAPMTDMQASTKKYVDDVVDAHKIELSATTDSNSGADKIGVTPIPTLAGENAQAVLESIKGRFEDIGATNTNVELSNSHYASSGQTYESVGARCDAIDKELIDVNSELAQIATEKASKEEVTSEITNRQNYDTSLQAQINGLVVGSGTSSAEVVQNRVDYIGNTHPVINTRTNKIERSIDQFINLKYKFLWQIGGVLVSGLTVNTKRIRTENIIHVTEDTVISLTDYVNFKFNVISYSDALGNNPEDSYWQTSDRIVRADSYFRMSLARVTETDITDIFNDALFLSLTIYPQNEIKLYSDIKSNVKNTKDMVIPCVKRTGNLWNQSEDINAIVAERYLQYAPTWKASGYIPVSINTQYVISNGGVAQSVSNVISYDSNKKYLGTLTHSAGVFTTGSNTAYVRISSNDVNVVNSTKMMLNIGNVPKNYVPYYVLDSTYFSKPILSIENTMFHPSKARYFAHRGYQDVAPENTIPAFLLAAKAGVFGIETDVYTTTDGIFVCTHDTDVSTTTDGTGDIRTMTYAQVQALTINKGNNILNYSNLKIPTLAQYLEVCKLYGCVPMIELKSVTNYQSLLNILEQYGFMDCAILIVDFADKANGVRTISNKPMLSGIVGSATDYSAMLNQWSAYENMMVSYEISDKLTDVIIKDTHNKGMLVNAYVPYSSLVAKDLFIRGVDSLTANTIIDVFS